MPVHRRKQRRSPLGWLVLLLAAALLPGALYLGFCHYRNTLAYQNAQSHMPDNPELTLRQTESGSILLSWQPSEDADLYCVEILRPQKDNQDAPEIIFRGYTQNTDGYPLPGLPKKTELTLRVSSVVEYSKGAA